MGYLTRSGELVYRLFLRQMRPSSRGRVVRGLMRYLGASIRRELVVTALDLLPPSDTLPILTGPLKGARWIVGASVRSCLLGSFEAELQKTFTDVVKPGDVVFDIGANVGFFTLLSASLVGPAGSVVAFEPLPEAAAYLHRHLVLNDITNVRVVGAAVSDRSGQGSFFVAQHNSLGRLAHDGRLSVDVVTIDEWLKRGIVPPPNSLKIDVEGGEDAVLRGARDLLSRHRPTVLLATHGYDRHEYCCTFLQNLGYSVEVLGTRGAADEDYRGQIRAMSGKGQ